MEPALAIGIGVAAGAAVGAAVYWLVGARLRALERSWHGTDARLSHSLDSVQQTLATGGTEKALTELGRQLGEIGALQKQLGTDMAKFGELREALRAPGPRGGLGEVLLENLLRDVLPAGAYATQHSFKDGGRVDAVVQFADRLVPIDAKFPLDAFQGLIADDEAGPRTNARRAFVRAVRGHLDAVHEYIRPDEGTVDYALMYVPGENIYHEIIRQDRGEDPGQALWRYAQAQGVTPVSPNTLYLYLQTIALALQGYDVARNARAIQDRLARLAREFGDVVDDFGVLGTHLRNARSKYEDIGGRLDRVRDRLTAPVDQQPPGLPPTTG